jgi:hypothetical protein
MTQIDSSSTMYFDNTMDADITFSRPINKLLLTVVSGTVNLSLDNGANFMNIVVGTYQFDVHEHRIDFSGGGVYSGFGLSF